MTSDLRIIQSSDSAESQNSEPNSLREVLLFCTVLLVEVYSLAVSFGGPFFEVGYFLLVVVSQTFAGAYIWAQLRHTDETLPLPELLAMGFAIGSASAAISQLIVRDLLGIRLFISPLIPIIGVAIWLVTKRNARLPVQITHATTNTLLWLLFPAPLALSFFVWPLLLLFVGPLTLILLLCHYFRKFNLYIYIFSVIALSAALFLISGKKQAISIALSLSGMDEIFDEAMAIGFSNWGINDHIGRVGDSISYYKLSHVWLGPVLELAKSPPMIITTSLVPIIIFSFIGLALWTLSFQIHKSNSAAGLAAILVFLQSALPEPENLAIRIAQCLVLVYLLTGITALIKSSQSRLTECLVAGFVFFVIFATRAQYGLILLLGYSLYKLFMVLKKQLSLTHYIGLMTALGIALILCFLVFFSAPAHATGSPNQGSFVGLFCLFLSFVALRSLIPLLAVRQRLHEESTLLYMTIGSSVIIFFSIPQADLSNAPSLTIAMFVSILISSTIATLQKSFTKAQLVLIFLITFFSGFFLRLTYDYYKWIDATDAIMPVKLIATIATNGKYLVIFSILLFIFSASLIILFLKLIKKIFLIRNIFLLTALSMSFGIYIATTLRAVTAHVRYQISLAAEIEDGSPMSWYTNSERLAALDWMRTHTNRDDIFAQNTSTPDYRSTAYHASLIISSSIHRRAYIEGVQSTEVQRDYPRNVSLQTERQRKELLRLNTSFRFPMAPSNFDLANMQAKKVKWFVVDLGNTPLRDWEPFATTRFMNEKVAILELAQLPVSGN